MRGPRVTGTAMVGQEDIDFSLVVSALIDPQDPGSIITNDRRLSAQMPLHDTNVNGR
jgi:hypothetical protein